MRGYDKILTLYNNTIAIEPDEQTLQLLESNCSIVPIELVLSQFKYCILNKECSTPYFILHDYLCKVLPNCVVHEMEVLC